MNKVIFLLCIVFTALSCRKLTSQQHAVKSTVVFLDSLEASKVITVDDAEGFFKQINTTDISIQMKMPIKDLGADVKGKFTGYLKTQVMDFSKTEREGLMPIWDKVLKYTHSINKEIQQPLQLVKIKTDHYGPNVFYTRGNIVFIPQNVLKNINPTILFPIMIHEWWHVLAEFNPVLRDSIYQVFGFERHGLSLKFPENIKQRLLTNPDGADLSFAIPLGNGNWLMPIIYASSRGYEPQKINFMGHLKMEVVKILSDGTVEIPTEAKRMEQAKDMDVFFEKIGDNTQYIIHPDEIAADNFMLALIAANENNFSKFSKTGRIKVESVLKLLKSKN
ncbi:MAG: hypothetical protein U0V54_03100 [Saprospiraceae bacterium]|nr:hypothetical protein [Saprospiraceae bacterium]